MLAQRKKLGGFLPARRVKTKALNTPELSVFQSQLEGTEDREISTTMAYGRILGALLNEESLNNILCPFSPMKPGLLVWKDYFRQIGIYSPFGQCYQPEDSHLLMYYKEDSKGQLLQEGISEAGAMASWIAAGTSYTVNDLPMIPFYIYYSMFGYQRFGDLVWAAADAALTVFFWAALPAEPH